MSKIKKLKGEMGRRDGEKRKGKGAEIEESSI